jgi:hypothetical protein
MLVVCAVPFELVAFINTVHELTALCGGVLDAVEDADEPQPAMPAMASVTEATKSSAVRPLFLKQDNIPGKSTMPRIEDPATNGSEGYPRGTHRLKKADVPEVSMVTCVLIDVLLPSATSVDGLKLQLAEVGSPLQAKV